MKLLLPIFDLMIFSSGGAVVMWCRMFAMTLNAVLCHSSIMINPKYDFVFLCCFWAKRGVILAKIKNDFPRVKSNHIERRAE